MPSSATMKLVVLWESELRAIAEAVARYAEANQAEPFDPHALERALQDIVSVAYVAFCGLRDVAPDAAWVLCNHDRLKYEPRVVKVNKPKE